MGPEEISTKNVIVKDMKDGNQETISIEQLANNLKTRGEPQ
jgi:histidyl-tRNA synthetase